MTSGIIWRTDTPTLAELNSGDRIFLRCLQIATCNSSSETDIPVATWECVATGRIEFNNGASYCIYVSRNDIDSELLDFFPDWAESPVIASQSRSIGSVSLHSSRPGINSFVCLTIIVTAWAQYPEDVDRCDESQRFKLEAYDKNNDGYRIIMYSNDSEELESIALALQSSKMPVINPDGTEPAWYLITDTQTNKTVKVFDGYEQL